MDDKEEEKINSIYDLIKGIKKYNEDLEKEKIDSDIINKIKIGENDKKNYIKLKYNKLYIVDKKPIADLLEELNYETIVNMFGEKEDENEYEIKEKIEELFKDKAFPNLENFKNINAYNTEEQIDEIINQKKEVLLVNKNILRLLDFQNNQFKGKEVLVSYNKNIIIIYFPKGKFSILINSSLQSNIKSSITEIKSNNINNNENNNNNQPENNLQNNINNNQLKQMINHIQNNPIINTNNNVANISINNIQNNSFNNNIPNISINNLQNNMQNSNNINNQSINNNSNNNIINANNMQNNFQINMNNINVNYSDTINLMNKAESIKQTLNRNINLVSNHLSFLNSIVNLNSLNIPDLNDINQIKNLIFNNNDFNTKINCLLINSENFEQITQDIFYEECQVYLNLNNENKEQKYKELLQKININDNKINSEHISIIKSYEDFNKNKESFYMFINEVFCDIINIDKSLYINSSIYLFKNNNELYLFFSDKQKIMKIYDRNQYFKISEFLGGMIDTPKDIVDKLIMLCEGISRFDEYLNDNKLSDKNFGNYYLVNKKWLEEYKNFYNYNDIVLKYEEQMYMDDDNNNNNNNIEQNNDNSNQQPIKGLSRNQRKKYKKRKNKNKNNKRINNNNNDNKNNNRNNTITSQHENKEIPEYLLNEKNILPRIQNFKEMQYFIDFEIIETQTLKNLCKNIKLNISSQIFEEISIEALAGNNNLILKKKDNSIIVYTIKGIITILEYIIIFDDRSSLNEEIKHIKQKGIDQYLIEKYLNFNDSSVQYLPDINNTTTVGKIYICNKKQIDYNQNNNSTYYHNFNNINTIIGNYQYSNFNLNQNSIPPCRAGLDNIGATCYMNATLQCLFNIPELQKYFLYDNNLYQNENAILSKAFGDVLKNLYDRKKNKTSYAPKFFKDIIGELNPLFKGVAANDSKDLILFLLEKMNDELTVPRNYIPDQNLPFNLREFRKNYYSAYNSIIQRLFIYEQESNITCCKCRCQNITYSAYNILIFPLEKIRNYKMQKYPNGFLDVKLEDCLDQYISIEYLQGDSMIYCNQCNLLTPAENTSRLNNCPEIFVFILNRGKGNEFEVNFDFPLRFDLYKYVNIKDNCTQYELNSVLVHTGGSDMSGHFFAYCKSNVDKNWYKYNDAIVEKLGEKYIYNIKNVGLPYVLFYQKVNTINNGANMNMNSLNNINNFTNGQITLYFKLIDEEKELYLDVNINELVGNVIQRLAQKYSNGIINFFNCYYYTLYMEKTISLDFNKTVQQNNLSNESYIIVKKNQ